MLLAVPFALTGGVYLLWLLGYNFSVAVWVGFIALFGTAVQTGVVMVIYLEEAVARKQRELGGALTRAALRDAVIEGALLRLRPKVMTVSHRRRRPAADHVEHARRRGGDEAAGDAGAGRHGVVAAARARSSRRCIFFWLQERRLGLQHESLPEPTREAGAPAGVRSSRSPRSLLLAAASLVVWRQARRQHASRRRLDAARSCRRSAAAIWRSRCCRRPARCTRAATRSRSSSVRPAVDRGRRRRARERQHADAGHGDVGRPGGAAHDVAGRYEATAEFGMAGRLADGDRMGRSGGTRFGQFRRGGAMKRRVSYRRNQSRHGQRRRGTRRSRRRDNRHPRHLISTRQAD